MKQGKLFADDPTQELIPPSLSDTSKRWTLYDDVDMIIAQSDLTSSKIRSYFLHMKAELRACHRKINELQNEKNERLGVERVDLPHLPFNDPPESYDEDLIAVNARTVKWLMMWLTICFTACCAAVGLTMLWINLYDKWRGIG